MKHSIFCLPLSYKCNSLFDVQNGDALIQRQTKIECQWWYNRHILQKVMYDALPKTNDE